MRDNLLDHVMNHSSDMICTIDAEGRFIQVSEACSRMLGYRRAELEGQPAEAFIRHGHHPWAHVASRLTKEEGSVPSLEKCYVKRSGEEEPILLSVVWSGEDGFFFCIARDAMPQKTAAGEIPVKGELNRLMGEHGADIVALLDEGGNCLEINGTALKKQGYQAGQLIGASALQFIHPEDVARVSEALEQVKQSREPASVHEFRTRTADGEWRWMEATLSNQLSNPLVQAIFVSLLDITHRKQAQLQLAESGQRFRSLFDSNPDMVLYQNEAGTILDANPAFLAFMARRREEVVGHPLSAFLPPESVPLFRQKLQDAFSGMDVSFEAAVAFGGQGQKVLSVVKVPLKVGESILGVHAVIKDITEAARAHRTVEEQARKLNTIFESITDGFLTLDRNWCITYTNPEFDKILLVDSKDFLGRSIWDLYPEEVHGGFYREYHRALETGESVHFQAYLERLGKWLEVKAFPSEDGLSVYFNDITPQVQQRQEMEKLSLVASKTVNSVVIMGPGVRIEWANESFTRLTGYTLVEAKGKTPFDLLFGEETDRSTAQRIKEKMESGKAYKGEVLIYRKSGEKRWFEVEVTPVYDEAGELAKHICMQTDITEKVKARKELEKLSLVASKTTNSVIITDAQGLTEWVNEGFTRVTGYTLAEMAGRKPGEILQGPETDPVTVERVRRLLRSGKPFTDEILNYKKSGEKFWVLKEITPVFDEAGVITRFIAVQNDVTERKKKEEELRKLSLVASKTSNSVIIMDAQRRVEWVNEGFTAMTGYSLAEVAGKMPGEVLTGHGSDQAELRRISEKLAEGVPFNSNLISYRKSGEPFWLAMDVSPVYESGGNITNFIAIQKDITSRKEAEENLVKLSQALYRQNKDLEQFTYIVSHNLRAPVANIIGLADLMARINKDSELYNESFLYLRESGHRLDTVLRDLNTVLSIRDSKGNLERQKVNVRLKVRQALASLQDRLEGCGGTVTVDIDEGLFVWVSQAYLYSIFYNLLSNAIKYRSRERTLQVQVKCLGDSEQGVTISLSDNGSGFDMERAKDRVFKLYQRFHPEIEGTGIGLYLVKAHLEAMGGGIEVTSRVGEGTDFIIYLPKT
ncbi:PAS domain-containing sensor histidine kinase [Rufibacter tibetensis]|uniref:histidine kinase n=1 Tax=Rufibacter tibetensis TaxID=512763 RepID=A0A0P0CKV0_9BACT|nr:PAS domain-containing sensor histidine kinase [Rufibacter tibetensis]ALJ00197.1 hypothetical protein DC20_16025 [Rufibacter tibetensis]